MKGNTMRNACRRTLLVAVLALLCGCSNPTIKRVNSETFLRYGNEIGEMNSAYWYTYIGASHVRAYMEFGRPSFPSAKKEVWTVYWTPLDEFPPELCAQLMRGENPWAKDNEGGNLPTK